MVPVPATAQNAEYNVLKVNKNIDAVVSTVDRDTRSSPTPPERVLRNLTISGPFDISVKLYIPPHGSKKPISKLHLTVYFSTNGIEKLPLIHRSTLMSKRP
jgi:hypothetical protein